MGTWQEHVAQQAGVLARWQALEGGLTQHAWAWRTSRQWRLLVPGVAVTHTGCPTAGQRAWAAVLHGGRGAALSGEAALALHATDDPPARLDLAVPEGRRVTEPAELAVTVHRVKGLDGWLTTRAGLPVTVAHVAALHAAAWAESDKEAEHLVAAAVQQRRTAVPLLRASLCAMPTLRRRRLVAAVLDDVELGAHAGSELQFLRFCRRFGLPLPDRLQVRVREHGRTSYLDARYDRARVCVELDGAHHREVRQWEADALRSLRVLVALPGERLVRLTPGMLRYDGPEVARLLRELLG